MEKSELDPKQVFDFVGYQFDLKESTVRPTLDRWQTLTAKIQELLTGLTCPVRQLMSLIGLLTATDKTGPPRSIPYEANTVAPEKQLEGSRVTLSCDLDSKSLICCIPETFRCRNLKLDRDTGWVF